MLIIFSSIPFLHIMFIFHMKMTQTPSKISNNTKFYPFLRDAVGAMDGTHINCCPSVADCEASCDYKGHITQNCLVICNFNMAFCYVFSGWDGSTTDSTMLNGARITDLPVPRGKYYLAGASFPMCDTLLMPY